MSHLEGQTHRSAHAYVLSHSDFSVLRQKYNPGYHELNFRQKQKNRNAESRNLLIKGLICTQVKIMTRMNVAFRMPCQ
jgi:hypothetical protein